MSTVLVLEESDHSRPAGRSAGLTNESVLDSLELSCDARVVDRASNSGNDATDQVGIDSGSNDDPATGDLGQPPFELLTAPRSKRRGRGDLSANNMPVVQQTLAIGFQHVGEQQQAIALG